MILRTALVRRGLHVHFAVMLQCFARIAIACVMTGCLGDIGAPIPGPPQPRQPPPPMPPPPLPPPIDPPLVCAPALAPGRTPLHRLTRLEYDRTIRDLTGDLRSHSDLFPADSSHAGFDNVSDVQTVSLLHSEKYEEAAFQIADKVWERELDLGVSKHWEAEIRSETPGYEVLLQSCCGSNQYNHVVANGAKGLWTAYRFYTLTDVDIEADYTVTVSAWTQDVDTATAAFRPLFERALGRR